MSLLTDLRCAVRQFRRSPGIPLIIVLSLGSAMGISSSLFSVVNAIWFRPWPVADADGLRVVRGRVPSDEWQEWPRATAAFSGLAAELPGGFMRLGRQVLYPRLVSANYFQVLRVPMALGRTLQADDRPDVAVVSHEFWQRRLAGSTDVIGTSIALQGVGNALATDIITVVGVAAKGFDGTDLIRVHLWRPLTAPRPSDGSPDVIVFGRLAPGASDEQAQAELSNLRARYRTAPGPMAPVEVLRTDRYSLSPPSLDTGLRWAGLISGLIFITLIACANVSNLILASGYARRGEMALRLALGGRRAGIVRQLMMESAILSLTAGAVGIVIAQWLPDLVLRGLTVEAGMHLDVSADARVLAWSLVVSLIACLAFGLVPALRSTRLHLSETLSEGQHNAKRALMPSLLSYQTIVSVMAIVSAGLMLRSGPVREASRIGDSLDDISVVRLDPPRELDAGQRGAVVEVVRERLQALAGGADVAGMLETQLRPGSSQSLHVTPEYFTVLRIPLLAGRTLRARDAGTGVVVNEAFARRYWPGGDVVGRTITNDDGGSMDTALVGRQVIGVVVNAQLTNPTTYVLANLADVQVMLVPAPVAQTARAAAALASRPSWTVPLEVLSGRDWVSPVLGPALFAAGVTSGFGAIALLLGVVGFFSLLEYSVQQRTREIGIRRALGASGSAIVASLIRPAALPLLRGLLVGSVGAALLAEFMRRAQLPAGIDPLDPLTYASVAVLLAITGVVASFGPARRALRIEPVKALRSQ